MTSEKALEAMKQGKKIRRKFWDQNVCIGLDDTKIIRNMTYDSKYGSYEYCMPTDLMSCDLLADDWEIHEPKTWNNCRCEFNPDPSESAKIETGRDLWFVKANQHTEEYANKVREILKNAHLEFKEETTMYTDLEITLKSGETITYSKGEWDDYSYDGKSVAVKKSGAWVGLYNFDNVFCVELKQ
jgi:hypothetical protein